MNLLPNPAAASALKSGQSNARALFSSLASGAQFYFLDADLPGGVNRLTCFRKTPTGYTNLVTGRHTRSNADFMVQPASQLTAMKTQSITIEQIESAGFDASQYAHVLALCSHLDCQPEDLRERDYDHYGLSVYEYGSREYAIGTDEEATKACEQYCRNSAWAFNASFIVDHCCLPDELTEAIASMQETKCESCNDAIVALVEKCGHGFEGSNSFTESAISADGRGHLLSPYDGEESEETVYAPAHNADEQESPELQAFWDASNGAEKLDLYIYRLN